ncbi:MAG: N-acetyltransferase [Akkermansiaceae bacterium]|nr:N-acetyltransferase [Armatimonadota bacterium]
MSIPFVFERLGAHHDRQGFDCGKTRLNDFLQRQARQNASRNVGVTHVAVPGGGDSKILAYYTLLVREIDAMIIPTKKLPKGAIGIALLGRLAVDQTAQGQGLGKLCLSRAMRQVETASRDMGIFALMLDAMDEEARAWYSGLDVGFETLLDDPNHLCLPVDTIRQLIVP